MKCIRTALFVAAGAAILLIAKGAGAQDANPAATSAPEKASAQGNAPAGAPLRLTLQQALDLARKNSTQFNAAVTNAGLVRQDRRQAFDALLPTVTYNNSAIYTQGAGPIATAATGVPVVFIANNSVHEYISQGNVHEAIDVAAVANFRRVSAAAAVAKAQAEIASRGLVVTVVQGYYSVAAAQQKLETAKRNAQEGEQFLKITQDLEHGGEVAQDLHAPVPLPTLAEVQQGAARDNPDVRAALEAVRESNHDVFGSRAGYLPSLTFDYFYGIDAARFAVNSVAPNGQKFSNLGSSAVASLNIPIWNWGTTQSRVKQAELRRDQAKRELSLAQRKLLAEIRSLYAEAETALSEQEGLSRSAQLAEESLRLVTLRYRNGESTVLEVVDAQTTFAQANAAYHDGAVRYRVSLANLQTLTGVLTTP